VAAAHGQAGAAWLHCGKTTALASPVAGALYFRDRDTPLRTLLGLLSASTTACTSRPAITRGSITASARVLQRFDPGAQGEHKIQRGFEPTTTLSSHWIAQPELDAAVGNFAREEQGHIAAYREEARALLPFKQPEG
jgi:hypothetical protein